MLLVVVFLYAKKNDSVFKEKTTLYYNFLFLQLEPSPAWVVVLNVSIVSAAASLNVMIPCQQFGTREHSSLDLPVVPVYISGVK